MPAVDHHRELMKCARMLERTQWFQVFTERYAGTGPGVTMRGRITEAEVDEVVAAYAARMAE